MITIDVKRNELNDIVSFTMSGHAESGPYGHDLVCAGASAISFGSINAVTALCNITLQVTMEEEGGFLRCLIPKNIDEKTNEKVQLLFEGMLISLRSIEKEYNDHIQIIDKGRR